MGRAFVLSLVFAAIGCGQTARDASEGSGATQSMSGSSSTGGSSTGGASVAGGGSAGSAGASCPPELPSGVCGPEDEGPVCNYVDDMGCPRTVTCTSMEGPALQWFSTSTKRLQGACERPGGTCRYTWLYFNYMYYAQFECGDDLTWHQPECPETAPMSGDVCGTVPITPGMFRLECYYDGSCVDGTIERTTATCGGCSGASGCTFGVATSTEQCQ